MKRIASFLVVTILLAACGKESAPPAKIGQPVMTMIVGAVAGDSGNFYSGEIRARHETTLGFRVGGKIIERLVDAGAVVKEGQVLMRLDPADTGLQSSAALTQLQLAEADALRYRELRKKGFVSQAALDAKEAAYKSAAAQTALARNQSAYTTLRADHDGMVATVLAEVGQVVGAGQPVLRLARDGGREVAISIPETQFSGLKIGAQADVTLWSANNDSKHFAGRLRELAPAADPASHTYPARVSLSRADNNVVLGMTAQVRFSGDKNRGKLIVPLSAIFQQGDQQAVWIVSPDNSVHLRQVQIAAYQDDGAVISGGVAAGERIVSAGVHKLTSGEKIRGIEGVDTGGNNK